jgi:hypothetical protein
VVLYLFLVLTCSRQVLCLSRNKITRIPGYFIDFCELDVLKVDHNPIEWPPKYVMETADGGREWITFMQKWMRNNSRPRLDVKQPSVDSFLSANAALDNSMWEFSLCHTQMPTDVPTAKTKYSPGHIYRRTQTQVLRPMLVLSLSTPTFLPFPDLQNRHRRVSTAHHLYGLGCFLRSKCHLDQ